ncbi:IS1634 family transposase [Sporotomaculum syntrophicum]|uniref:IS1634 family transposase n=1 Tax=Sporotomaculum syntrophicum TaxID=182264 RepID=UPI00137A47E3
MFFRKITSRSNGKEYTYLKLIENYREGDKVKQRVVANLGSIDKLTPEKIRGLIAGLSKICGSTGHPENIKIKKILRYGEVLALHKIWELFGMDKLLANVAGSNQDEKLKNIPLLVELMVINQLVKPQYRQAISDWYKCLYMPSILEKKLTMQNFSSALDVITVAKEELEKSLFEKLSSLMFINTDTDLAFCLLDAGMIEPALSDRINPSFNGEVIPGVSERYQRVNFGLLVSRGGMPIGYHIWGETSEEQKFQSIMDYLKRNFDMDKCIFVGERSRINNHKRGVLAASKYDYIMGSNCLTQRDRELFIREWHTNKHGFQQTSEDIWLKEIRDGNTRYLIYGNPIAAKRTKAILGERLSDIENELKSVQRAVDEGRSHNVKSVFNQELPVFKDSYCRKYFEWHYDDTALEFRFRRRDELLRQDTDLAGAFLIETNNNFLRGQEILKAYTSLAILGDSFNNVNNFALWPSTAHVQDKASAHILICMLAAMMEKTLERLIRQAGLFLDVHQALLLLEEIKVVIYEINGQEFKALTGISNSQDDVLNALGLFKEQRIIT